jgi:hypothetical protein
VRVLDADDEIGILEDLFRGGLRIHVLDVVLVPAHSEADDVDEGQHAGLRAAQDLLAIVFEIAPAGPPASATVVVPAGSATSSGKRAPLYP